MEDMSPVNINSMSPCNYILDSTLIKLFFKIVKSGNLEEIKIEVGKLNRDINSIYDENDQNVLTYAALIRDDNISLEVMRYFIEQYHVDPTWEDKYEQTPLFYTARNGLLITTAYLIDKGCLVNEADKHNQTPIFYAAR
jgi:ankyrin repeat protein